MVAWDGYSAGVETQADSVYIIKGKQKGLVNGFECGVGEKQEPRMTEQLEKRSCYQPRQKRMSDVGEDQKFSFSPVKFQMHFKVSADVK